MSRIRERLEDFKPQPALIDNRGPTVERLGKLAGNFEYGDTGLVTVRKTTIERALKAKEITKSQADAAVKLHFHWYRAQMAGKLKSSDLERIFGSGGNSSELFASENSEFHWQRLISAIKTVKTNIQNGGFEGDKAVRILELIVFRDWTMERAGREIGFGNPQKASVGARLMLGAGLNILAKQWGL